MAYKGGVDGPGLAALAVGSIFLFAGVKGYSVLIAIKDIIQGKPMTAGQNVNALTGGDGVSGGSVGGLTSAVGQAPANAKPIYLYLRGHGLSPNAAAGVIGNIAQESGGNPESAGSGGNGLIGWTPPLSGAVTQNPARDLQFQLDHLMIYINSNGSVSDINSHAGSAAEAALYFMNKYERPAAATENSQHRMEAANATLKLMGGK